MTSENRPAHSPLGASGAERWMNCPGSVALLRELELPESDEPDYRRDGTLAHSLAERCLTSGSECWEEAGWLADQIAGWENPPDVQEICEAVQVFVSECRSLIPADDQPHTVYVEQSFNSSAHPLFYGTTDFAVILPAQKRVSVRDYKHGVGIAVDVDRNPQVRYYGHGTSQTIEDVDGWTIDYAIVQPRAFHPDGKIRRWSESLLELRTWVSETLVPAMLRAELENDLDAGPWCRFCPAKLVCPLLTGLFKAAVTTDPKQIVTLRDQRLDLEYRYLQALKFYVKALEEHAFNRANAGGEFSSFKLVRKKADRVWKPEAAVLFKSRFGDDAFTAPELKSPAQMEKVSEAAKDLVHSYAYTPEVGLTVAPADDKRAAVAPQSAAAKFGIAAKESGA